MRIIINIITINYIMDDYSTPISQLTQPQPQPQPQVQDPPQVNTTQSQLLPPPSVTSQNPQPVQQVLQPALVQNYQTQVAQPTTTPPTTQVPNSLSKLFSIQALSNSNNLILPIVGAILFFAGTSGYGTSIIGNVFKINKEYNSYINTILVFLILYIIKIQNSL